MQIKIHKSYRTVVSLCDSNLIGKKFEEGNRQLDIRENFYKDKEVNEEEAINLLQFHANEDATFNIVGQDSINASINAGIITEKSIAKIDNIPFTLMLL